MQPPGDSRATGGEVDHGHYLVKAPQRNAAYHDSGVQSEPGEEASTLQGHICQGQAKER